MWDFVLPKQRSTRYWHCNLIQWIHTCKDPFVGIEKCAEGVTKLDMQSGGGEADAPAGHTADLTLTGIFTKYNTVSIPLKLHDQLPHANATNEVR